MPVTNLKSVPPSRSPARATLAVAIERQTAAQRQIARLNDALERAHSGLYGDGGASRAASSAAAALAEAQASESQHLAAVAMGEATPDQNPVAIAERVAAQAKERLANANRTQDALKEQVQVAERELVSANDDLAKAVRGVLREEATGLINATLREAELLKEQLGAKRALLSFLQGQCFAWDEKEARQPISDFMAAPAYPWEWNGRSKEHPALAPWHQLDEALKQSADAPLPI